MAALSSFIADGFADDCDELIHQCLKEAPVTFKVFSKVFRKMQISSLFHDRQSGAEIAELSEEVINIAKYYMVANTGYFEESVVGLFLVYALVNLQPFEEFACLRLVEEDVPYIERIEQVARRDKRVDVLYVLGRVLTEHTRFLAAVRERGMEPSFRKYLEGCSTVENLGLRPKGVFLRQNEELDIIKELTELQVRYDEAKVAVNGADLKYTNEKLPMELEASLKNIVAGVIHEDPGSDNSEEVEKERIRSIKTRAMKAKVNPMKHLVAVNERSPTKTAMPYVSDIKTASGGVKSGSPTKKVTPTKTKVKITPKRQKRKRPSHDSEDTTTESDMSLELSEHDSDCVDINLENFDKPIPSTEIKGPEPANEVEIDSSNLRIGALPCVITSEDNGKMYEIEIIDKCNQSTNKRNDSTSRREFATSVEQKIKKGPKEKRDLKKTILKSRFKRMGIEPIANFKTS